MTVLTISPVGPHDFELCLRIAGSFSPDPTQDFSVLRAPVRIQDNPTVLELRQVRRDPVTLEIRTVLLQVRGLGPWSADYFLVRGLSRPDRVPADDLGVRKGVGHYLGRGQRLSPRGTM